jgi:hypothetical protein
VQGRPAAVEEVVEEAMEGRLIIGKALFRHRAWTMYSEYPLQSSGTSTAKLTGDITGRRMSLMNKSEYLMRRN